MTTLLFAITVTAQQPSAPAKQFVEGAGAAADPNSAQQYLAAPHSAQQQLATQQPAALHSAHQQLATQQPAALHSAHQQLATQQPADPHFAPQEDLDAQYAGTLLKAGVKAPEIALKDIKGKEVKLSQFRGRKVVLLFWASWCPDCRAEIPELKALHAAAQPDKVAFVSVSFDRSFETLCQFVEENYLPGVQLFDPAGKKDSKVGEQYGIKWIPSLYLIDEEGTVQLGTVMLDKVAAALKAHDAQGSQTLAKPGRELCSDENCAL